MSHGTLGRLVWVRWKPPSGGSALDWLTNHRPSVLWHCWLGHLTRKIISKMTYNVSSGTLNSTIPYASSTLKCVIFYLIVWKCIVCIVKNPVGYHSNSTGKQLQQALWNLQYRWSVGSPGGSTCSGTSHQVAAPAVGCGARLAVSGTTCCKTNIFMVDCHCWLLCN